jgi:hypothetical protein
MACNRKNCSALTGRNGGICRSTGASVGAPSISSVTSVSTNSYSALEKSSTYLKDRIAKINDHTCDKSDRYFAYRQLLDLEFLKFKSSDVVLDSDFSSPTSIAVVDVPISPLDYQSDKLDKKFQMKHQDLKVSELNYGVKNKTMEIGSLEVSIGFRKKGLSLVTIEQALKRHPEVNTLKTKLSGDNYQFLNAYCNKKGFYNFDQANWETKHEAILNSPAYKIRQKLGFAEIKDIKIINRGRDDDGIYLVTKKNKNN